MRTEHWEETLFNFGETTPDGTITFSFKYIGPPEDFEYYTRGCGCTSSVFDGETLSGTINISSAGTFNEKGNNPLSKQLTFYKKDGLSEFIANDKYERIPNPDKGKQFLTVSGVVVVE